MKALSVKAILFLGFAIRCASGQTLNCSPAITILGPLAYQGGYLSIVPVLGGPVTFKYTGVEYTTGLPVPDALNYVVMIPSSGAFPGSVMIGWNPLALPQLEPGVTYSEIPVFTVGQTPGVHAGCRVDLTVPAEPDPVIQSVVNAASLQPVLSPGAMVSIFGSHLTGPTLSTNYDLTASYPTSVASTSVTFNGIAAPLLYVSPSQVNAIVPFALAGQASVQVAVQRFHQFSTVITLPLQSTSPAIFTTGQNGSGQGAILQQGADAQFTYNSSANPAPRGAALEVFATGMGTWTPTPQSDLAFYGGTLTAQPVSVTIGGQPAKVLYAGRMGGLAPWSVLQVNVVVPDGIGSGSQTVVLKVGANDNSQQGVTVSVQ